MMGWTMLCLVGLSIVSSCTKEPLRNLTEEESRIYITNRDKSTNFSNFKTYSISDSVYLIDNNKLAGFESRGVDLQTLSAVRAALESRGYLRVNRTASPDIGINVSRLYNTSTSLVNLDQYWGGYGGYYDPFYWGYGGFGYGYPSAYGLVQSTEAMISVDILDLKNAPANQSIRVVWNGLIRGSGIFSTDAVTTGVKALFEQSPYIRANQ